MVCNAFRAAQSVYRIRGTQDEVRQGGLKAMFRAITELALSGNVQCTKKLHDDTQKLISGVISQYNKSTSCLQFSHYVHY